MGNDTTPIVYGIGRDEILAWFAQQISSASDSLAADLQSWADVIRGNGTTVDEDYFQRCLDDLAAHGRLTAETMAGIAPVPPVTIGEPE